MSAPDSRVDVPPQAVKRLKVADAVVTELREWLRSGEVAPGARLPAERELAARFGVSRTSLRDAVRRLELLGHLQVRQGDGTYVRTPDGETLSQPFRELVSTLPHHAHDLLEFRLLLEPQVAALAAQRLSAAGEAELRASLQRQQRLVKGDLRLRREDLQFHAVLARAAGNAVVLQVLDALRGMLSELRALALPAACAGRTHEDHQRVAAAVLARDPEAARQAMHAHLRDVTATYQRAIQGLEPTSGGPA